MTAEGAPFPEGRRSILIEDVLTLQGRRDIFINTSGRIEAEGEGIGRRWRNDAEYLIEGRGLLAIPGLVNTHTHAAMSLLRGYADDLPLQTWLSEKIWPLEALLTGEDVYWGTRLACLEMIRSGTIAFADMYFFMEDAARAVAESGLKAMLSYGFIDLSDPERREREIQATERLVAAIRGMGNPKIRPALGPHAVYTVSEEGLRWCAGLSAREGIPVMIHLAETEREIADAVQQHGRRPVQILDECGILTPRTVAAHGCWLDRAECALLGERGVHVSHNPASNMKLAVGRAMPYSWLREAGVNVTLGTDGCASNNNLDLFEEMKTAALLQKFSWNSPTLLPASEALTMATSAGARALGLGNGIIAPGEPADIVLIDRHAVCNTPLHHPASNLVYSCTGSAVRTVICDGDILMEDRVIPWEEEVIRGASAAAADLVRRGSGK
ncbi:MAG: amidohydrolase family protein [Methanomicrobiales archaeon]|nr:amidohydrolase family protein [Methanomicrobiales archaeon]NYT20838.1 amidohydrolase family protein [Methanomicrobiales archaeon]